jgi:hypothetical protein
MASSYVAGPCGLSGGGADVGGATVVSVAVGVFGTVVVASVGTLDADDVAVGCSSDSVALVDGRVVIVGTSSASPLPDPHPVSTVNPISRAAEPRERITLGAGSAGRTA